MQNFSLPLDPAVLVSVSTQNSIKYPDGSTVTGTLGNPVIITDPAYIAANTAAANTVYLKGVNNGQNTYMIAINQYAASAYNFANGLSGGTATDGVARLSITQLNGYANSAYATANSAQANTIIIQGVDVTQNTRLNSIETINSTQNVQIFGIQGVDLAQNTAITIIQGVDNTQNVQISGIQGVDNTQNTQISGIQGVDLAQNTAITALNQFAQGAYSQANTATTAASAFFPAGTALLFQQTSAPTGWTKVTTHNDKALRVVSGTAGSGGSVAFTTAFASQSITGSVSGSTSGTVGGTTLSESQIPSHTHWISGGSYDDGNGSTSGSSNSQDYGLWADAGGYTSYDRNSPYGRYSLATGGGGSHTHGWSGSISASFSGNAVNLAVNYVDVIIATKN